MLIFFTVLHVCTDAVNACKNVLSRVLCFFLIDRKRRMKSGPKRVILQITDAWVMTASSSVIYTFLPSRCSYTLNVFAFLSQLEACARFLLSIAVKFSEWFSMKLLQPYTNRPENEHSCFVLLKLPSDRPFTGTDMWDARCIIYAFEF